ncbi:hypothetical protein B0J17DRAFT_712218 [Rhizoctonia solani]|nr:hypothetical protein B0J17DRAFT_712218 [Rhizoctonia solani]
MSGQLIVNWYTTKSWLYWPDDLNKMPLGVFMLDESQFLDTTIRHTNKAFYTQVGGGGPYAAVDARTCYTPGLS